MSFVTNVINSHKYTAYSRLTFTNMYSENRLNYLLINVIMIHVAHSRVIKLFNVTKVQRCYTRVKCFINGQYIITRCEKSEK